MCRRRSSGVRRPVSSSSARRAAPRSVRINSSVAPASIPYIAAWSESDARLTRSRWRTFEIDGTSRSVSRSVSPPTMRSRRTFNPAPVFTDSSMTSSPFNSAAVQAWGRSVLLETTILGDRLIAVDDNDRQRRDAARLISALDALDLDRVRGVAQAGSVHERHGNAADVHALRQHVARRAWYGGHDRPRGAGQRIEQARLARIRPPDDDDEPALAQHAADAP